VTKGWRIALRNLTRNRRRNLATGLAIALGYAGLVLLGGYATRIELFLRTNSVYVQHGGHVAIYRAGGLEMAGARPARYSLTAEHLAGIGSVLSGDERVERFASYLRGMGLAGNGCRTVPFVAIGLEPGIEAFVLSHPSVGGASLDFARPLVGRPISEYAELDGAVGLSAGLARFLGKTRVFDQLEDPSVITLIPECGTPRAAEQIAADANIQLAGLTFDGSLSAIDGEVVNLFRAPTEQADRQTVLTGIETLRGLYATEGATYVAVYLKDWRRAGAAAAEIGARLAAAGLDTDVYAFTDERLNPYYVGSMGFLGSMVLFIVILVGAVVALGLVNATTLTVYERTREIGTYRALGYTRSHLVRLFLRETTALALVGVAGGLVLALAIAALVNLLDIRFSPPGVPGLVQLIITPGPLVCAVVAALLVPVSVLVTWIVVRRRVRIGTAELLTATTA
jgi:putative ABC transport system permease protein